MSSINILRLSGVGAGGVGAEGEGCASAPTHALMCQKVRQNLEKTR